MALKILIAGGGTGGHIYPAIAMAQAIQEIDAKHRVEFVGTATGLEAKLVPRAGFRLNYVPIGRLNQVSLAEKILTLICLPWSILRSIWLLLRYRPHVVLGVGGYASGPLLLAAALMKYSTAIWEPNAYPGFANRILSRFVDQCFVVFDEAKGYLKAKKIISVPMPVRKEIEILSSKAHEPSPAFRVLLFGGSQGARPLNNALCAAIVKDPSWLEGIEIVHQTGSADFARIQSEYAPLSLSFSQLKVYEYLHDMPARYAWADMVISRSGTGTISEIAACGKAALLIPLPSAADDHQTKNAQALAKREAAVLLPQKELTPGRLVQEILRFKSEKELVQKLSTNIRAFHQSNGARAIAQLLLARENQ